MPSHGGGGSTSCSIPHSPAASDAAIERYGFASAPGCRYSIRVAFGEPPMSRTAQVRFSRPHVAVVGAQVFSTERL